INLRTNWLHFCLYYFRKRKLATVTERNRAAFHKRIKFNANGDHMDNSTPHYASQGYNWIYYNQLKHVFSDFVLQNNIPLLTLSGAAKSKDRHQHMMN